MKKFLCGVMLLLFACTGAKGIHYGDTPFGGTVNAIITNPSPIAVSGSFSATAPYAGPLATPAPSQGSQMAAQDSSGKLQALQVDGSKYLYVDVGAGSGFPTPPPIQIVAVPSPVAVTGAFPTPPASQAVTGSFPTPIPFPTTQNVFIEGASPVPVTGAFPTPPSSQAVTGSFPTPIPFPTTQNVFIAGASPVPVTGAFPTPPSSQAVTGSFPTPIPFPTTQNVAVISSTPIPILSTNSDITTNGTASTNSLQFGGVYFSATPTPTPGKAYPLSLDNHANVYVNVSNVSAFPTPGTYPTPYAIQTVVMPSPAPVTQSGNWNLQYNMINANATLSARQTVTGSESYVAAPSNSVAVIVECESVNADNLRWGFSNSTSGILTSTLGMLCEPGRDTGILPAGIGTYLHMISTGSGSDYIDVQWILTH